MEHMQNLYQKVSQFFCFEMKKKSMEDFFGEINTFRTDYLVITNYSIDSIEGNFLINKVMIVC